MTTHRGSWSKRLTLLAAGMLWLLASCRTTVPPKQAQAAPDPAPAAQAQAVGTDTGSRGEAARIQGGTELSGDDLRRVNALGKQQKRTEPEEESNTGNYLWRQPTATKQGPATMERVAPPSEPHKWGHGEVAIIPPVLTTNPPPAALTSQPPTPVTSWLAAMDSHGGSPADPQIAVGPNHVVVTAVKRIAFYSKSGTKLAEYSTGDFFSKLNLDDKGIQCPGREPSDMRTIFDSYRKRFWIVGGTGNTGKTCSPEVIRGVFTIAVSKTANPLDGFWMYWTDAVAHWNVSNSPVYKNGDAADYPILGIDPIAFHLTNSVGNSLLNQYRYWRVLHMNAEQMAAGQGALGWQFWDLRNPDDTIAGLIQPAVHHGSTGGFSFYVSLFGKDKLLVWRLSSHFNNPLMLRFTVPITAINPPLNAPQNGSEELIAMTNLGNSPLKAVVRNGMLALVMHDAVDWFGDGQQLTSIRYLRLRLSDFVILNQRTFGKNSGIDDKSTDRIHYGWPAVELNKNGDAVFVYTRTGSSIAPEARYSVWYNSEADIRPSRVLRVGDSFYDIGGTGPHRWGDLAGASADPEDPTAVWIAHEYANANHNYDIWVGKIVP